LNRFVERYSDDWQRLHDLVQAAEKRGLASLTADQLQELGTLYREAASHLARARTEGQPPHVLNYLNDLVGRAHGWVYTGTPRPPLRPLYFFGVHVPSTFRRHAVYVGAAVAISVLFAALSFGLVLSDQRWAMVMMPSPQLAQAVEDFVASNEPAGKYFAETASTIGSVNFAAFLMIHNIHVALMAFALGITFGLGTFYVLATNGLMLGAFLGLGAAHGRLLDLLAVVAPHGVLELSAVFIAGGAGLMLARAIVDPGDMFRADALKLAAFRAVKLAVGTVPMFVVAGLLEGLVSPQASGVFADNAFRILLGCVIGTGMWLYLLAGDLVFTRRPGRSGGRPKTRPDSLPATHTTAAAGDRVH